MAERRKRPLFTLGAGLALAGLAAIVLALVSGGDPEPQQTAPDESVPAARFAALSAADSNRCGLGAADVRGMGDQMRLQGSCCFPMDEAHYDQQLDELRRYRGTRVVPRDPYDVSAELANRLLRYRDISLDHGERAAYGRAVELSELGGPCCCPCWRWQAFKGQARFLLARRDWSGAEVAQLWEIEEGCGGGEHA